MQYLSIISHMRLQDIIDVLFLSIVCYHLFVWFKETKAFKSLIGLLGLGAVFTAAKSSGLFLTTWVFQIFWQVLMILIIILFQTEIRKVLERVNPFNALGKRKVTVSDKWLVNLTEACFNLARKRIGATLLIERNDVIDEYITGGIMISGEPVYEIIASIFSKDSPIHDGAVLIRDLNIAKASCYLPLSSAEGIPKKWGTRHRSALGITEKCDTWAIVVSEERGEVSLAKNGVMETFATSEEFKKNLQELTKSQTEHEVKFADKFINVISNNWRIKIGTIAVVSLVWLVLAGQQDFEVNIKAPLKLVNIPNSIVLAEPYKPSVALTIRGLRKDAATLSSSNVEVALDISEAANGKQHYRITANNVLLPNNRLDVVDIDPDTFFFEFGNR